MRFGRLAKQFDIWSATIAEERDQSFGRMLKEGRRMFPGFELLKAWVGASDHTAIAILTALVEPLPGLVPGMTKKLARAREALKAEILEAMGDGGVMLYPVYPTPAPHHGTPVKQAIGLHFPYGYTGIVNAMDLPATAIPLGLNDDGLPLGVQAIAAHGQDHVAIATAIELERALGGWVFPSVPTEDVQ